MGREQCTHLVAGPDGDLLLEPVAAGAAVDQVDAELLELLDEERALLDAPLLPHSLRVALRAFRPVGRADAVEQRPIPGGPDLLCDPERTAQAVLERAAILIRANI